MESDNKLKREKMCCSNHHNSHRDRVFWGLLVILAGVILLLTGNGTIDMSWRDVFFSWHMILIIIGLQSYLHKNFFFGTIMIAVSMLVDPSYIERIFDLSQIEVDNWSMLQRQVFYVVIILFGIWIVLRGIFVKDGFSFGHHRCCKTNNNGGKEYTTDFSEVNINSDNNGRIDYEFAFSGSEQVFLEPVFRGGRIKAAFGGLTLDLTKTTLPEGTTVLDIDTSFGGVELHVPDDWYIEIRRQCFCGGFDDKRSNLSLQDRSRCLVVNAKCCFGGGEINNN